MTDRLPFDPDKIAGPPQGPPTPPTRPTSPPTAAEGERAKDGGAKLGGPLTVTQLGGVIKKALEERVASPVRVVGEISNLSARNHYYFSLKDDKSVIGCVAWASTARKFAFKPADGQEVVASGEVNFYGPQGRVQLYVKSLQQVGAGELEQRYRQLCDALRKEGYFAESRKRLLPLLPRRVAVITSSSSAAWQDVLKTARERLPAVGLVLVDARMQGSGSAEMVASAIRRVNAVREEQWIDAIIVTRGGGSIEDLWSFNERVVADAVYESALPVVAAIGHESDTTIIELVADVRASTPTQAVMRVIPDKAELVQQVEHVEHRLRSLLRRRVERERDRVDGLARNELLRDPRVVLARVASEFDVRAKRLWRSIREYLGSEQLRVERLAGRLAEHSPGAVHQRQHEEVAVLAERMRSAMEHRLRRSDRHQSLTNLLRSTVGRAIQREHEQIRSHEKQLRLIEVQRVLQRGFSYTMLQDGSALRSIQDIESGDHLRTHLADGIVESTVGKSSRRRKKSKQPSDSADGSDSLGDQMNLFSH